MAQPWNTERIEGKLQILHATVSSRPDGSDLLQILGMYNLDLGDALTTAETAKRAFIKFARTLKWMLLQMRIRPLGPPYGVLSRMLSVRTWGKKASSKGMGRADPLLNALSSKYFRPMTNDATSYALHSRAKREFGACVSMPLQRVRWSPHNRGSQASKTVDTPGTRGIQFLALITELR
jgi:hypothetical protein